MQEVKDRQAIFDCIKRNSRGNDRFDVELITSSYHPDGIHELGQSRYRAANMASTPITRTAHCSTAICTM